jgi:hypothetical protein
MKLRSILTAMCFVGMAASVASATLVQNSTYFPIDETGWEYRVSGSFSGSVAVVYDKLEEDEIWIEIRKDFQDPSFDNDMGQALWIEFKLVDMEADNYAPVLVIRDEFITNSTGRDWMDFHMALSPDVNGTGYTNVGFDPEYLFEADIPGANPFATVEFDEYSYQGLVVGDESTPLKIDFFDGIVPDGGVFEPGKSGSENNYVRILTEMEEGQVFYLKEWPTIPEPATLSLLSFGLIPLLRRRKTS